MGEKGNINVDEADLNMGDISVAKLTQLQFKFSEALKSRGEHSADSFGTSVEDTSTGRSSGSAQLGSQRGGELEAYGGRPSCVTDMTPHRQPSACEKVADQSRAQRQKQ